jgi:hypothetical protein
VLFPAIWVIHVPIWALNFNSDQKLF